MSHYQYGLSTVNFGTPVLSAFGIISNDVSLDQSPNVNATVENETGSIVVQRVDDVTSTYNFNGVTNNGTSSFSLTVGALASVTSSVFSGSCVCENLSVKWTNKGFTGFSAKLVNHPYVNYSIVS